MEESPETPKDLHYLITRIINPILNSIIATLHDGSIVYYRDGTVDVTEYSTPELMARFLADWRDELWYKYSGKNLTDVSEDILYDYMETINYIYRRLHHINKNKTKEVGADMILLGQKLEEYLTGKIEMFSGFTFEFEKNETKEPKETNNNNHPKEVETTDIVTSSDDKSPGEDAKGFGICPRCAVYDGDKSEKKLYQCPYCGEWFCEKHVKPTLVLTFDKYQELWKKHLELREFLEEEWHREDGHPCYPYTRKFWEEYEGKKKRFYNAQKIPVGAGKINISRREVVRTSPGSRSWIEPKVSTSYGTWTPKDYTHYDHVIINVKNRFKDWGSIYVTPREIQIETSNIKKVIPRSPSIRFEIRDGKRWIIIPENLYFKAYTSNRKYKTRKYIKKYALIGIAVLILILAGYLYSQGSFNNIGLPFLGN
ncbi:hypothetical protein A3L11_02600 [Thermococcus siculi]|uniref:Uncharacterized protein n=2 Tax=Thermococcus siculi TaxID=72803 RepID=A0A2Z2MVG0_9EURY|nr:hypothetical protein A3L11_02600 [Thermococcus siculi]